MAARRAVSWPDVVQALVDSDSAALENALAGVGPALEDGLGRLGEILGSASLDAGEAASHGKLRTAEWDESLHPRDDDGRWTDSDGSDDADDAYPGDPTGIGTIDVAPDWEKFRGTDKPDDYYYHVTTEPAAAKILAQQALLPASAATSLMGRGGSYGAHSTGRVFLTDRNGVFFWAERAEAHAQDKYDDPSPIVVVRIPKSAVPDAEPDPVGSDDARAPAYVVPGEISLRDAEWREELHPRAKDGKFAPKSGSGVGVGTTDVVSQSDSTHVVPGAEVRPVPVPVFHRSRESLGRGPDFDAYFGTDEFSDAFAEDFGPNIYEVTLPPDLPIIDLNQPTPDAREFMAQMAEVAFPKDVDFPAQLRRGDADALDDFYDIWTDKAFISAVLRRHPEYAGAKYQAEYLLPAKTIAQLKMRAGVLRGASGVEWDESKHPRDDRGRFAPVDTPEFRSWFRDSKVVNAQGAPLVVYHGSVSRGVREFDPDIAPVRARTGPPGIYFTSDARAAGGYTRPPRSPIGTPRGEVVAAYLSIQNPLDITAPIADGQKRGLSFGDAKREALKALKPEHDGVIFRGDRVNPDEYVVFHSSQIKSVRNRGTFDPASPIIVLEDWDESKHPRDDRGRWTHGGSGAGGKFAGAPVQGGVAWVRRRQRDYDEDPKFRVAADMATFLAQGSTREIAMASRIAAGDKTALDKDPVSRKHQEESLETPYSIAIYNPMAKYKGYFQGQERVWSSETYESNVARAEAAKEPSLLEAARILNSAVDEGPTIDVPMYRGLRLNAVDRKIELKDGSYRDVPNPDFERISKLKSGDSFDLPGVQSFTTDEGIAKDFSLGVARGQVGYLRERREQAEYGGSRRYSSAVVVEVEPGARGLPIASISPWRQREVLTRGKFEVVRVERVDRGEYRAPDFRVVVRQRG